MEYTNLEKTLADALSSRHISFRTQVPTRSGFVLDFLIGDIVIEADGPCHDGSKNRKRDRFRDKILETAGYKVHRLSYNLIEDPIKLNNYLNEIFGPL